MSLKISQLDFLARFERTDPFESNLDRKHNRRFILHFLYHGCFWCGVWSTRARGGRSAWSARELTLFSHANRLVFV